jgi:hypothetical protein
MSSDPRDTPDGPPGPTRPRPSGAQGASRGGFQPDEPAGQDDRPAFGGDEPRRRGGRQAGGGAPFGGFPFGGSQPRGGRGWGSGPGGGSARFLGLPVALVYAIGAAIIGLIFLGAVCSRPAATGSVAGQVKALNADRTVTTLAGAQLVLTGAGQTYTTTSTDVPADAEGEAAYNYHFENVPPGQYSMAVTPPPGSNLQPEDGISFKVEPGQLFPQSVMLLAQGIQKPRALAQNELQPGEAGGYINDRGERVTYQQGGGFDWTDALLLYLLWRNPPGWGYGAPPVIISSPSGSSTGSSYRVADPPSRSSSGQTVTQQKPSVPGQGSTRPSSSSGGTGSGPSYSSGGSSGSSGASSGTGSSSSGNGSSTQTRPSTGTGSGGSVTAPSVPSQGASRPSSSSTSRPSTSSGSRSSGGGRR